MNIALLIPCFNNLEGLHKSLASIHEEDVCVVVYVINDGSDFRLEPEDFYLYGFSVVVIENKVNLGIEASLRLGVEQIDNDGFEFFSRLDCGDTQYKNRISIQVSFLRGNLDHAIVGSYANAIDPSSNKVVFKLKNPLASEAVASRLLGTCCLCHPTITARTKFIMDVGNYRSKYICAEDYDLYLRVIQKYKIANYPDFLVNYEFSYSESSISSGRRPEQLRSRLRLQIGYFNIFSKHSYFGVLKTGALLVLPYKVIVSFKKLLWSSG